jgi:hypothetical protein
MTRPKKLTPYLECNIGGSLAAAKETNGGFYLSPSVGAQVKLTQKLKMNIALSYEIQQLETLKQRIQGRTVSPLHHPKSGINLLKKELLSINQ